MRKLRMETIIVRSVGGALGRGPTIWNNIGTASIRKSRDGNAGTVAELLFITLSSGNNMSSRCCVDNGTMG